MADVQLVRPITSRRRFEILKRDGFTCQYCGRQPPHVELQVDHVIPRSRGGGNEDWNLTSSCRWCNGGKGSGLLYSDRATPTMIVGIIADLHRHDCRIGTHVVQAAIERIAAEHPDWWNFVCQLEQYLGGLDLDESKEEEGQ